MTRRLDNEDMLILRCASERKTFREMAEAIQRAVSVTHTRVKNLQALGLLTAPDGKARSVMLTEEGKKLLGI